MKKSVIIGLDTGLEARPVALLVQKASQFSSKVYLEMDTKRVNAKSIMGVMSLVLINGAEIVIDAEGTDEEEAITALETFLTAGRQ